MQARSQQDSSGHRVHEAQAPAVGIVHMRLHNVHPMACVMSILMPTGHAFPMQSLTCHGLASRSLASEAPCACGAAAFPGRQARG